MYKTKYKPSKDIDKMKAHLVVKGYKQKTRINYEVFAPVAQSVTIKMIIGLVAKKKLENTPNGRQVCISKWRNWEEVYVDQLEGYVRRAREEKLYKVKNVLYDFNEAPRSWYTTIDKYF